MIISLDHIVLTVKSITKSKYFYSEILGLKYEEFKSDESDEYRSCLKFGNQKINLHQQDNLIQPGAKFPTTGSADICFISKLSINEWVKILDKNNVKIVKGPVSQVGANKNLRSIYIRDPDFNLVEIANYK